VLCILDALSAFDLFCPLSASGPRGEGQEQIERYEGPIMLRHDDKLGTQKKNASASSQETSRDESQQISQEELRRRYLEQQRRLACPGCGEEPFIG